MAETAQTSEVKFRGVGASRGVCIGRVLVLGQRLQRVERRTIQPGEVAHELERLEQAFITTRQQLHEIHSRVNAAMGAGDAAIFDAHLLVLDDPTLIEQVTGMIESECVGAEYAYQTVADRFASTLEAMEDDYLRERVGDLRDVMQRVLNNLHGVQEADGLAHLTEPCIVLSHDLAPSTTALLDKSKVLGFGTDIGGKTSHTAILARSLRIPAVVALQNISQQLHTGQTVLLDGYNGLIIVNPTDQTLFEYGQLQSRHKKIDDRLREIKSLPAVTLDGVHVSVSANVEEVEDGTEVIAAGAEGIGLFRTEYLFLNREVLPSEDEQFEAYRKIARILKPQPVIFRTLDIGGDKLPVGFAGMAGGNETNPSLGWRAIRFCLEENHVFRTQLRALLRASVEGNLRIMYPMVSGVEELDESNARLEQYKEELRKEGMSFDANVQVGAMIEVPSAVMVADVLARRVKFFSIGTNDLIQYSLAADRMNEKVAHLYDPTHPAILRLIKMTVDAGHRNGIWVGVCGEMASDPVLVPLLLGLGVDELSAAPPLVPQIKYLVRRMKMSEARELASSALNDESSHEILVRAEEMVACLAPELFPAAR